MRDSHFLTCCCGFCWMLWAEKLVKNKAMGFSREVGNCQWSLGLSCFILFHKIGYVTTGKQEGGKLQMKTVKKFVWPKRELLAAITRCWGTVSWMPGRGISPHTVAGRWHTASWYHPGFHTWIFRVGNPSCWGTVATWHVAARQTPGKVS